MAPVREPNLVVLRQQKTRELPGLRADPDLIAAPIKSAL
jgi:hypothetical protein